MTMPRMSDRAAVIAGARRALEWLTLDPAALAPFVLGVPTLQPKPDRAQPDAALAALLLPHQRGLWRCRALAVLGRLGRVVAVYALALGILRLRFVPALPWLLCGVPALALAAYGFILARRQRPGLYETACLLDRRYGLHDVLGTAAELGASPAAGGLPALTVAHAIDVARRLPERAWEGRETARSRRLLGPMLIVVAVAVWIAGPRSAASPHAARQRQPGMRTAAGLAQVVTHPEPALPRARQVVPRPLPGPARLPAPSNAFAASLQTHAGPPLASAPVVAGSQAPVTSLRGQLGAGPGGTQHGAASSLGGAPRSIGGSPSGKPPIAQAAPSPVGQRQAPPSGSSSSGAGGQSQQAQQGGGGTGSPDSPTGSTSGQQPAGSAQADPRQGSPAGAQPGAPGGQGANPFGQDPRPPSAGGQAAGRSGASGARGAPSGTTQPQRGQTSAANQRTQSSNSSSASSDGLDPRLSRHGTSSDPARRQARAPVRQAGAANGPEVVLGSGRASQAQVPDPRLVRVLPSGSSSLSGLQASGQLGPQRVQGYVPEDATTVSPAEQSLLLAYFAQNGAN